MDGRIDEDASTGDQEKMEEIFEENGQSKRPFVCDVCNASFNRRSTLWNHRRIHSESRPFICSVCNHQFKWKNSLKCHRAMHVRKGETEQDIHEGVPRRRKRRKAELDANFGTATKSVQVGEAISDESSTKTGSIDQQYCPEEQTCVIQLPILVSTIFEPVKEEREDGKIDWCEYEGNGKETETVTGYYAKVLPCHMW